MNQRLTTLEKNLNQNLKDLEKYIGLVSSVHSEENPKFVKESMSLLEGIKSSTSKVQELLKSENTTKNYLDFFLGLSINLERKFTLRDWKSETMQYNSQGFISEFDRVDFRETYQKLTFSLSFFEQLDYFAKNIVVIGANGSGKTSLARECKVYLDKNSTVISSQKILFLPVSTAIVSSSEVSGKIQRIQDFHKTDQSEDKSERRIRISQEEFQLLSQSLVTEHIKCLQKFKENIHQNQNLSPPITKLDKVIEIWNSLIKHRSMKIASDVFNVEILTLNHDSYPAGDLSEGEKVILFHTSQVLLAPENGFIIVDEPEMHLHKSIVNRLWDSLEREREDCIFIYLTHDLDFATSRVGAKNIWVKSYDPPTNWQIQEIQSNIIPDALLYELLGSKKTILFCESEPGKIDKKVYTALFPSLTIKPVNGCFNVINYTKAFNQLPNISIRAIGLIDRDHHPEERLASLENQYVYNISLAEVENLLLDIDFLKKMQKNLCVSDDVVDKIFQDILKELSNEKEVLASRYAKAKIEYCLQDSNIAKSNTLIDLKKNFKCFTSLDIESFYNAYLSKVNETIEKQDYEQAIKIFNNKGLKKFVEHNFKIGDFHNKAITFLRQSDDNTYLINKYFPQNFIQHL